MEYKIMSRKACERYASQKHDKTSVVISIHSSWDTVELPRVFCDDRNNIVDILSLGFDDFDLNDFLGKEGLITEEQALQIYAFCYDWYGLVDVFIFHCDGGISRSAGCCAAIMRWFEGDDRPVFGLRNKHPNMLCYNRVLDACRGISGKSLSWKEYR